ncbi:MAG: pilus assembly protein PilZ [Caulobacter sp.]|nr:pilus assembly protein PilZ [Caulobacter sp.]
MSSSSAPRPQAPPVERRRNQRQRALLTGKLSTDGANITIDCVIKNISVEGALVETGSPHLIPNELHLLQVREGIAWDARVIWRRGSKVGLELLERHDLRATTARQLKALRHVWKHMAGTGPKDEED